MTADAGRPSDGTVVDTPENGTGVVTPPLAPSPVVPSGQLQLNFDAPALRTGTDIARQGVTDHTADQVAEHSDHIDEKKEAARRQAIEAHVARGEGPSVAILFEGIDAPILHNERVIPFIHDQVRANLEKTHKLDHGMNDTMIENVSVAVVQRILQDPRAVDTITRSSSSLHDLAGADHTNVQQRGGQSV